MRIRNILGGAAVTLVICAGAAQAELAISANDGKQLRAGDPTPVTPDSVTVIDMGHYPPKIHLRQPRAEQCGSRRVPMEFLIKGRGHGGLG